MNIIYYDHNHMDEIHYEEDIVSLYQDQYLIPRYDYTPTPVIILQQRDTTGDAKTFVAIPKRNITKNTSREIKNAIRDGLFDLYDYTVEAYMDKNLIPYADWHDDETDLDHAQEIARKNYEYNTTTDSTI